MRTTEPTRWRSPFAAGFCLHSGAAILRAAGTWCLFALATAGSAAGQGHYQRLDQMHHTAWTAKDGLTGSATSLAQTPDGFLWIGTSDGLFRFDGVRFEAYRPERGTMAGLEVSALAVAPDGGLWVGHSRGGVTFVGADGSATGYTVADSVPIAYIRGIAVGHDGVVWVAAVGGLGRYEDGVWTKVRDEWGYYASRSAWDVYVAPNGTLWVGGASSDRVHFLPKGTRSFIELDIDGSADGFASLDDSTVVYGHSNFDLGTVNVVRQTPAGATAVQMAAGYGSNHVAVDRQGFVWVAGIGVTRLRQTAASARASQIERFTQAEGLSGRVAYFALTDREGTVWVATDGGLDRFRHRNLTWTRDPLEPVEASLVTGPEGEAWLLTNRPMALRRARDLAHIPGAPAELENGYLDQGGNLWLLTRAGIGRWAGGRFRKLPPPQEVIDRAFPFAVVAATRERSGPLWASINGLGAFVLQDSRWTFREILPGRPDWTPISIYADDRHRVWLVYRDELAMVRGDETRIFTKEDGVNGPLTTVRGSDGMIWLGGEHGLAFFRENRFHPVQVATGSDLGSVTGIVPTNNGVWLYGSAGIVYLPRDEVARLGADPTYRLHHEVFDLVSDLPDATRFSSTDRSYVRGTEDGDGVVWFVTNQGLARVDPHQIVRNPFPPPVAFRAVIADDRRHSLHNQIELPPLTRNLRIEYTALSLVLPERVRFRHRLEGWEDDWHEAGDRREVTYTDLRPGRYALRVTASNNDGVWNETGAALHFTVAPAWFQTTWFRALVIAILVASLVAAYSYRVRRIAAALHARFDERLAERTRIARDLHDTLLQTVQGSKLVADDALASDDVGRLRLAMERLSGWLGQAVNEGRGAVKVLRDSTVIVNDLAESLRVAAEDSAKPGSLSVTVSVRGSSRDFHPIVRDEIYRIGNEAIRNAAAHSQATTLAIELEYAHDLVLRIIDNGLGIDPAVAASGKPGRFGLSGMRERAANIGATLTVDGTPTGTCVTLIVPGRSVFRSDPALHRSR